MVCSHENVEIYGQTLSPKFVANLKCTETVSLLCIGLAGMYYVYSISSK